MTTALDFFADLLLPLRSGSPRVLVAYSGGLDSTVLLHALAKTDPRDLVAVHVHHGLQAQADEWAEHCARFCAALKVPLTVRRAQLDAADDAGPEAAAREARYALLRETMNPGDWLATAHHRDDQAETVLLRLLRGSGVHGLAAMRSMSAFPPGRLWRPLLDTPRSTLLCYAEKQGLEWIEDPHNQHPRYARSWLRGEILPRMRERWPQTDASLARAARLAAESVELLDVLAAQDQTSIARADALSVDGLLGLSPARRHNLLRYWLRAQGFEVPFAKTLARIESEVLAAPPDATPLLRWTGCELRRYRDALYAMTPLPPPLESDLVWAEGLSLILPEGSGRLDASDPPPLLLRVRGAREGESFRPGIGAHARSMKNLFQEAGLPPWARARVPVLELDGKPACIPGVAASAEWGELLARSGWQAVWRHALPGVRTPIAL